MRNVSAIPGKEKIHAVADRNRNMQRILGSTCWNDAAIHEGLRERNDLIMNRQRRYARELLQPPFRGLGISHRSFTQNEFRNVEIETQAAVRPPFPSQFLMRGHHQNHDSGALSDN